ncbi:MAG: 5'-methylthioadenosine/adenosylhomocysteine nucleosidase [Ileibacterium sp.]|nr:5'-methylthioadenosine/adenosylhomocysteine nucleosidase [Ileibacterium sp.]
MIGIIAAMKSEMDAVVSRMKDIQNIQIGPALFAKGKLSGKEVVVGLSGVGKTAASMTTTILILEFKPEAVINVGVAGGLLEDQQVCDLVISDSMIQADFDTSPLDGPEGIGLEYKADEKLMQLAQQAAKELGVNYHTGAIASQDLFMAREEDFQKLMEHFPQSACSEMEGAAVASAASAFGVPVLVLRSLSDVVHHTGNPMEFSEFAAMAAKRAADLMEQMCSQL